MVLTINVPSPTDDGDGGDSVRIDIPTLFLLVGCCCCLETGEGNNNDDDDEEDLLECSLLDGGESNVPGLVIAIKDPNEFSTSPETTLISIPRPVPILPYAEETDNSRCFLVVVPIHLMEPSVG